MQDNPEAAKKHSHYADNAMDELSQLAKEKGMDLDETFETLIDDVGDASFIRHIVDRDPEEVERDFHPLGKYAYHLVKMGQANGELPSNPDDTDLANFLETMEEDIYEEMFHQFRAAHNENIYDSIRQEFKQYDMINKHLLRSS